MISKTFSLPLRTFFNVNNFSFGAHAHKVTNVIQTKNNPQQLKQLRGQEQLNLYMEQYERQFYYLHRKSHKPLSLYNVFSKLPLSLTNHIANSVSDPKVTLTSDQIYLPKISENSIPIYESIGEFPNTLRLVNKLIVALPIFTLATAHMPFIAFTTMALHYFLYFRSTYSKATERLVIKMELLPETQQLILQKITKTGCIRTFRVRTNDIEAVNPTTDVTKYQKDLLFERSLRNVVDLNLVFRVISTGEILMFDRQGIWHEEGLNHELMPHQSD